MWLHIKIYGICEYFYHPQNKTSLIGNECITNKCYYGIFLSISTSLPIRIYPGCFPSGHEGRKQSQNQSGAIKQHVEAIRDQPQTVGPHTIEELHKCEGLNQD